MPLFKHIHLREYHTDPANSVHRVTQKLPVTKEMLKLKEEVNF